MDYTHTDRVQTVQATWAQGVWLNRESGMSWGVWLPRVELQKSAIPQYAESGRARWPSAPRGRLGPAGPTSPRDRRTGMAATSAIRHQGMPDQRAMDRPQLFC
jgi:hypothetical protein